LVKTRNDFIDGHKGLIVNMDLNVNELFCLLNALSSSINRQKESFKKALESDKEAILMELDEKTDLLIRILNTMDLKIQNTRK
jgi:hypothetical protein